MAEAVDIDRPILKWGNSYGIRLTQADLQRLGIRPGDRVRGRLVSDAVENHLEKVRFLRLGLPTKPDDIERLIERDILDDDVSG